MGNDLYKLSELLMDEFFTSGPLLAALLLLLPSLTYAAVSSSTEANKQGLSNEMRTEINLQERLFLFGPIANNGTLSFIVALTGGLSCLAVPYKIGVYSGWLTGIVAFVAYNFLAFILGRLFGSLGLLKLSFICSIALGPIGLVLLMFNVRVL